jgi:hypothetical protein
MHTAPHKEAFFLVFEFEHLPPSRERVVMCKPSPSSHSDEPPIGTYAAVADRPVRGKIVDGNFDMLPNVRFGIDDAHVRLVSTAIDEYPIFQLKESMARIILTYKLLSETQIVTVRTTYGRMKASSSALCKR